MSILDSVKYNSLDLWILFRQVRMQVHSIGFGREFQPFYLSLLQLSELLRGGSSCTRWASAATAASFLASVPMHVGSNTLILCWSVMPSIVIVWKKDAVGARSSSSRSSLLLRASTGLWDSKYWPGCLRLSRHCCPDLTKDYVIYGDVRHSTDSHLSSKERSAEEFLNSLLHHVLVCRQRVCHLRLDFFGQQLLPQSGDQVFITFWSKAFGSFSCSSAPWRWSLASLRLLAFRIVSQALGVMDSLFSFCDWSLWVDSSCTGVDCRMSCKAECRTGHLGATESTVRYRL